MAETGLHDYGPREEHDERPLNRTPHYSSYEFSSARYKYDSGVGKWMKNGNG